MDEMVLTVQQWLNRTYTGRNGYNPVTENGKTGWETMYGLTRALQIELGIASPADSFGPTTLQYLTNLGPISMNSNTNPNIVLIIQGGMYCKGYSPGGFTGNFGAGTQYGISQMQTDLGVSNPDGVVTPKLFKALLTMDAYVLLSGGDPLVRAAQMWLNSKYINRKNFYYIPCDGLFSRDVQKALVYGIQYEEGLDDATANGNFGPTTQKLLPTIHVNDVDGPHSFVQLFQAAMLFNHYDAPFDGIFSQSVSDKVKEFQAFTMLPQTGIGDFQTWASLLVSTGDPTRKGKACDSVTEVTLARGAALKAAGYETVGRYLTNVEGSTLNKKIQPGELENIFASGLTVFPIYQTYGGDASYFNEEQGKRDALAAYNAAVSYGFKRDTIIYFAVDFDAYGEDITNNIIPHFKGINEKMNNLGGFYQIGVYGPRAVCSNVSENNYALTSFVSGMSTGYSGNLGYPLPTNWAFDQISTISVGSGESYIQIDNDIKSNRDSGSSEISTVADLNNECFEQIGQISLLAMQYLNDPSYSGNLIADSNQLVTEYYRKDDYNSLLWWWTSGEINADFIDYVTNSLQYVDLKDIVDPITSLPIGVEHFMATMSAQLYRNLYLIEQSVTDFAGWTGDLITTYKDVVQHKDESKYNGDVYQCALDYIGTQTYDGYFSFGDLAADIDAANIATILANDPNKTIYNAVQEYYQSGVSKRFSTYYKNRFGENIETLISVTRDYLYGLDPVITAMREQLMGLYNFVMYTDEDGEKLSQAFVEVFLNYVNQENMSI